MVLLKVEGFPRHPLRINQIAMDTSFAIAPKVVPLSNTSALNEYYKSGFRSLSYITQLWMISNTRHSVRLTSGRKASVYVQSHIVKPDIISDLIRIFRRTKSQSFSRLIEHIPWLEESPKEEKVLEQMLLTREKEEQYEKGQLGTYNLFLHTPMWYIFTDILDVNSSVQLSGLLSEPDSFSFP